MSFWRCAQQGSFFLNLHLNHSKIIFMFTIAQYQAAKQKAFTLQNNNEHIHMEDSNLSCLRYKDRYFVLTTDQINKPDIRLPYLGKMLNGREVFPGGTAIS